MQATERCQSAWRQGLDLVDVTGALAKQEVTEIISRVWELG